MNESQFAIKITVYQSDQATEPCEIKKFQVPRDRNTNFNHLLEKIRKYYKSKGLRVFWTDNEGDEISIDSDEDLQMAQSENSGGNLKLKVVLEDVPSLSAGDEGEGMDLDSADEDIRDLKPEKSSVDGNYILSLMVSVVQCLGLDPVGRTPPASATSYLIRVAAGLSTKLTKSALLMTSIFLLTVLSWFLPAYITNSIVYFILAVTLGLPIATLALGHLMFGLISVSPNFVVTFLSMWALRSLLYRKRQQLLRLNLEYWNRRLEHTLMEEMDRNTKHQ